jgi:hypothetical protein
MEEHKKHNLIPNSTQMPNLILDLVVPRVPEAEARCLLYVCRRTFGFHKESDRISFSQFIHGIRDRSGKPLDYGTGLSRQAVANGLRNLVRAEVLIVIENSKGNFYRINLEMAVDKVVYLVDQSRRLTKSSLRNRPKAVYQVDTQKKGNKEKQSSRQSGDPPVDNRLELGRLKADLYGKFSIKNIQIES